MAKMTRFPAIRYVPYIVEKMVNLDHGPGPLKSYHFVREGKGGNF